MVLEYRVIIFERPKLTAAVCQRLGLAVVDDFAAILYDLEEFSVVSVQYEFHETASLLVSYLEGRLFLHDEIILLGTARVVNRDSRCRSVFKCISERHGKVDPFRLPGLKARELTGGVG